MSSKRALRRRACEGKVAYPNKNSAQRALRKLEHRNQNKTPPDPWPLESYKCRFCPKWHNGHARSKRSEHMRF